MPVYQMSNFPTANCAVETGITNTADAKLFMLTIFILFTQEWFEGPK